MWTELTRPFRYKRISLDESKQGGRKKARNGFATLKRIWTYLAKYRLALFLAIMMICLSAGLNLLGPLLIGRAIDNFLLMNQGYELIYILIGLSLIYFSHSLTIWLQNYWMIGVSQKTVYAMRKDLFSHFHKLPISYFDKRQHGELMSRVTNDIENVSTTLNRSIIQILSSVLTFVGICIVMVMLSPLLTMLTVMIVPAMYIGMKWITKRTSVFFKKQQQYLGDVNGYIEETITGQKIVKTFSQEERVIAEFNKKNGQLRLASFWAQTYSGFIPKFMNMLNNSSFAVIAFIGGILVLNGQVSIGVIVIFTEYARQFTRPLNDLANQFNTLLSAIAGAERVFAVMDEEVEKDAPTARSLDEIKGEIVFNNVSFAYEQEQTIANLSFYVEASETVAIVGPTGAGKTTIIQLLSRFYDPGEGEILLDGQNIMQFTRESLRAQMGFVLQDTFLFEGTIRENIRYGKLTATDEEVEEAAKKANAYSFIKQLSAGFDTVLDQDGSGISQGQKQLLSISRVILSDPPLLILDEATSSIDTVTEIKIQEALQTLMKGRTSIVIAHRLNTIQQADKILVLKDGKLIEQGTDKELMDRKRFYYNMHNKVDS